MKTKSLIFNFTLFSSLKEKPLLVFLIFLTLIGFFLRFFKLSEWFFFMIDEDIHGFLIKRMLFEKKPLLVGLPFPGDIYLGPLFYYIAALIMILSRMNPIGWAVFVSLIGTITIPLIYYVGKKIFNSSFIGFTAAILYSFSYLINIHNRTFDRPVTGPILTLIVYLALYQIIKKKKINWVYPLSLTLTLAAQTEGSHLSLIFLTLLIWIIYKLPVKHPKVLKAVSIFLLSHITVLIFDLRHNFTVIKALVKFFSFQQASRFNIKTSLVAIPLLPKALARILFISGPADLTKQILPCKKYLALIDKQLSLFLIVFAWFILLFFAVSFFFLKKKSFGFKIISAHLLISVFGLMAYGLFLPGYAHEWFFVVFFSSFCLITAYFFEFLWKSSLINKVFVFIFLLIFAFSNFKTTLKATSSYGFKNKNEAVLYAIQQVKEKDFYLESLGSCYRYGYRYLFWLHQHEPVISYMDYLLAGWLYPKVEVLKKPETGVIIVNWEDKETPDFIKNYNHYLKNTVERKTFEQIEILITDESVD